MVRASPKFCSSVFSVSNICLICVLLRHFLNRLSFLFSQLVPNVHKNSIMRTPVVLKERDYTITIKLRTSQNRPNQSCNSQTEKFIHARCISSLRNNSTLTHRDNKQTQTKSRRQTRSRPFLHLQSIIIVIIITIASIPILDH